MWSVLVLFMLLPFAEAVRNTTQCPNGCNCSPPSADIQLTVDCGKRPLDVKELTQQLDSMLSDEQFQERLVSLTITNTPLTRVPASICQLMKLTSLYLDRNNFTELPDKCFTRLSGLVTLSMTWNSIGGLQDGLFDGLQRLVSLNLANNLIASIGLRVFSNASDLTSLRSLDLSSNKLTSLEPWWYYRCIQGNDASRATIGLSHNMISNFTNELGFNFTCGMKRPLGVVDLNFNLIIHVQDLWDGWNLNKTDLLCIYNVVSMRSRTKFLFQGYNYACDCIDIFEYRWSRAMPRGSQLIGAYCSTKTFLSDLGEMVPIISVPLTLFICNVTDHCPSSCRCVYRPGNLTFHVYCSSTNMTSLPLDLPPLPKSYVRYKLDFSNNKLLRRLEHRPYFANTSILDISNCGLTELTVQNVKDVSRLRVVNFHGNMLQSFPRQIDTVHISARLVLGSNPWKCSCDNSWIIEWLNSMSDQISDPGDMICRSPSRVYGRNVLKSTKDDFCVDPAQRTLKISVSVAASVIALIIIVVIGGLLFYTLREKVFRRWKFHPFDRDECVGEDMEFDVFLCCSYEDHRQHGEQILELMEVNGYRVCYHERDFLPGELISNNISQAVERSKRTVCLVSDSFLRSPYCITEFDMAYHHNVAEKRKKRLIVLMKLDNPNDLYADDASDKATLRQFLRQYTYIDYTKDNWFDRLLYALPLQGLLQQRQAHDDDVQPLPLQGLLQQNEHQHDDVPILRDHQPADD